MPFKKPQHHQNVEKVTFKKAPLLRWHQISPVTQINLLMTRLWIRATQHNNAGRFSETVIQAGKVMQKCCRPRFLPQRLKTSKWRCSCLVNTLAVERFSNFMMIAFRPLAKIGRYIQGHLVHFTNTACHRGKIRKQKDILPSSFYFLVLLIARNVALYKYVCTYKVDAVHSGL